MASPPTSSLISFLDEAGTPLAEPGEWTPGLVAVQIDADALQEARLLRNGSQLPLYVQELAGKLRVLAHWPRSGCGRYRCVLELDGQRLDELNVSVRPAKLGELGYAALINDLQGDQLPTSVVVGLERTGALAGLTLRARADTTLNQELLRLRRAVTGAEGRLGLAAALTLIAQDPHRQLIKTELWVRAERARRLEPVGLVLAMRMPNNLDSVTQRPIEVPDVRVEHTVDAYENRLTKLYHDQVDLRLRRLAAAFQASNQLAAVIETEDLLATLRRARQDAAFLDELSLPAHVPMRLTMVLLRVPAYRAVLQGYLEFRREAYVELDEPTLESPLENLPDLYQTWGTLQVIDVLLDVGAALGYSTTLQRLAKQVGRGVYVKVLPDGEPAVELIHPRGTVARLIPERSFSHSSRPLRSISFSQRPDVVLEIDRNGDRSRVVLFDPKYKLRSEEEDAADAEEEIDEALIPKGQPKKIDIDRMHAYRDAIRDDEESRVVDYAAILYPGPERRYAEGIEALSARPEAPAMLRERLTTVLTAALAP